MSKVGFEYFREVPKKYQIYKEKKRQEAIDWLLDFNNHNYSWEDLLIWQQHWTDIGKRYGLTKEFKENGII